MNAKHSVTVVFCGLLLGAGCVLNDEETQGSAGLQRGKEFQIRAMTESDRLEPLLRDLVKEPANLPGPAAKAVAVPAKVPPKSVPPVQEANVPSQQDGYTFCTNAAGEAVILGFDKGYSGALVIAERLGGCRVTEIGIRAFQNCPRLTNVVFPSSVTRIGEAAFEFCHGLTRVTVPATVTTMGGNPFGGCHRLLSVSVDSANPSFVSNGEGILFSKDMAELICYPAGKAGDYMIPDGVTRLGRGAFLFCPQLTRVVMPNSVTTIGDCVFFICPRLTQVTLSENVSRIGMQAFESCNGLTELTIPASVTHLVGWAFRGCGNLASVYFKGDAPAGGADTSVLSGADKATVYYRLGTKGWGPAFAGRPTAVWDGLALDKQKVGPAQTESGIHDFACVAEGGVVAIAKYTGEGGAVVIPAKVNGMQVTAIKDAAFRDCPSVTSVVIPNGVTRIGIRAFCDCTNLNTITIPSSVNTISFAAFSGCTNLTAAAIHDGVTEIGQLAFCRCVGLTAITIPASVTRIGNGAFAGCSELSAICFEGNLPDGSQAGVSIFGINSKATVYYRSGTKGWGAAFGGRPTAVWKP